MSSPKEELPAWERKDSQSPAIPDPDRGWRGWIALIVLGVFLFIAVPFCFLAVASCQSQTESGRQWDEKKFDREFQLKLREKD